MIKRILIFMIPFAVIGWMVHSGSKGRSPQQGYSYERFAKPNEGRIRTALMDQLQHTDPACIEIAAMPYDSTQTAARCNRCEALVDAGLLEKSLGTAADNPAITAVRYDLTAAGRPLYTEEFRDGRRRPGMCFGHTVIGELELWTAGVMSYPVVDVRYVPKIEHPHELLYGPQAKALGLPELERGHDVLPKSYLCAALDAKGIFSSSQFDVPSVTVNGVPRCSM